MSGARILWAAFSQDAETLERYVESPRSIDKEGKPIIACVEGKEFALADVIKMEQAGISYPFKIQLADSLTSM